MCLNVLRRVSWLSLLLASWLTSESKSQSVSNFLSIHGSTNFRLDGDTESAPLATSINGYPTDWDYFVNNNYVNNVGFFATGILNDNNNVASTTYEGGSSKDINDISLWKWGPDSNEQAKTNIFHSMAYGQKLKNINNNNNEELIIYFGADRLGGEPANSAFGFWFIQDETFNLNGVSSGSFTGTHFSGDLLITANFENPPQIKLYEWIGHGTSGSLQQRGSLSSKCDSSKSQSICAIYNEVLSFTSLGYPLSNNNPINEYAINTFMEGGINVGAWLNNNTLPCYSKILSMTRTSTSEQATLKDFTLGSFKTCVTPSPTLVPTFVPSLSPTFVPTSRPTLLPTSVPTLAPTASPVTPKMSIEALCKVNINNEFCFEFDYNIKVCNYGDRTIYNLTITSEKDDYIKNIDSINVNECIEDDIIFEPIRQSANDPILSDYTWSDTINVIGKMLVGGVKSITLEATDSFECPLCQ
jgi:hypothetical protein